MKGTERVGSFGVGAASWLVAKGRFVAYLDPGLKSETWGTLRC
jgi:hypothetical protein